MPEGHTWGPNYGRSIYVRPCYEKLATLILEAPDYYFTLLGNPGTGFTQHTHTQQMFVSQ